MQSLSAGPVQIARHCLVIEPDGQAYSGGGLLASIVAKQPEVQAVLAVEVCEDMATLIIPKVARWVLGAEANKVVPLVGSFDDLQIEDESVDFIIEMDSFHHSGDLTNTFRECARVMRHGGRLLCFDRCHPDSVSDDEVESMLAQVYSREFLIGSSYPLDIILTRRDNGEHEYRLFEWKAAFQAAGFRLRKRGKFLKQRPLRRAIKGVLSLLPRDVRRLIYKSDDATIETAAMWMAQRVGASSLRWGSAAWVPAPKDTTVFLLEKS